MRRLYSLQPFAALMLAGMAATAQVSTSRQNAPPTAGSAASGTATAAAGATSATPAPLAPGVTITGHAQPLPKLAPDEFDKCTRQRGGLTNFAASSSPDGASPDMSQMAEMSMTTWLCETKVNREMQVVIDACLDRTGRTPFPRMIQACTESLAHKLVEGDQQYFLVASRAYAYFGYGDRRHALEDYTAAIKLAPHNGELYFDRGVVFAAQSNVSAALQDLDTAMTLDSRLLVPALTHRARIYAASGNLSGALADYSQAISLQPKAAVLWSDRGYVALSQHDYNDAVKDEAQAVELDPRLARAYYLRGVAFGDLGNRANAVGDLRTAVGLDASLARYVIIQGKSVTLSLPPL